MPSEVNTVAAPSISFELQDFDRSAEVLAGHPETYLRRMPTGQDLPRRRPFQRFVEKLIRLPDAIAAGVFRTEPSMHLVAGALTPAFHSYDFDTTKFCEPVRGGMFVAVTRKHLMLGVGITQTDLLMVYFRIQTNVERAIAAVRSAGFEYWRGRRVYVDQPSNTSLIGAAEAKKWSSAAGPTRYVFSLSEPTWSPVFQPIVKKIVRDTGAKMACVWDRAKSEFLALARPDNANGPFPDLPRSFEIVKRVFAVGATPVHLAVGADLSLTEYLFVLFARRESIERAIHVTGSAAFEYRRAAGQYLE
jgi:hypothetical protein